MKSKKELNLIEKFILRDDFFFWIFIILIIIISFILSINNWGIAKHI